ncbi:MAG TPA: ABC transporter permease, partial [Candidatus Caccousia stercoris]|nr:ABC transporter permease [Candidatus Caccousia stercoris]
MLCKLAFRNVTRSIRDFTVYFLTLAFGVCLFYVFNSIDAQQAMIALSDSQKFYVAQMTEIMAYVSVFVAVVFGLLVVYANRFL